MIGKGVIVWQRRLLVYEPVNHGYRAHFLGETTPQGISDELRAAIEADQRHQAQKAKEE